MRFPASLIAVSGACAAFLFAGAVPASAETVFDTSLPSGTTNYHTVGQVITVPATDTRLATFSLYVTGTATVRGEVYAWDGTKATGPALYESPNVTASPGNASYGEVPFTTGGLDLAPGGQYVLFATGAKGGSATPNPNYAYSPDSYPGGHMVARGYPTDDPAKWTTEAWQPSPASDATFRATFVAPPAPATGTATATATGAGTTTGGKQPGPKADTTGPALSTSLSAPVFRAAGAGPALASKVGTKVFFSLSEAGAVRFTIDRRTTGRRAGRGCVARTKANAAKRPCTLWVKVPGSFTVAGRAGRNAFTFRGRMGGRKLKPAGYRLSGQASDPAGNRSAVRRRGFRIVP